MWVEEMTKSSNKYKHLLGVILVLFILSCDTPSSLLSDLDYSEDEIFSIKIDKYGFPNVKLDNLLEPIWIIWDTGDMTGFVLSKDIIEKNHLTKVDSIHLVDSEGKSVGHSYRYVATSLKIFNKEYSEVKISTAIGDYNGLIGPRHINLTRFSLDYQNKKIGISDNSLSLAHIKGEVFPLIKSDRFPRLVIIKAQFNGEEILIEIDTGKSRTVVDPELVNSLNLVKGERGVVINKLLLGEYSFEVSNAKMKSFKGISRSYSQPIMIGIGSDILKDYIFTVDYEKEIVILDKIE